MENHQRNDPKRINYACNARQYIYIYIYICQNIFTTAVDYETVLNKINVNEQK